MEITALLSPDSLCSSAEPQWLFVPHLGPCRKRHRRSWQMPQPWVRRGLPDIPVRDVCLQHDRGHGADAVSHHPHQVGLQSPSSSAGAALGVGSGLEGLGHSQELQGAEGRPTQLLAFYTELTVPRSMISD